MALSLTLFMLGVLGAYDIYSALPHNNAATVAHDFDRGPDFHPSCESWDCRLYVGSEMVTTDMADRWDGSGAKPHEKGSARR